MATGKAGPAKAGPTNVAGMDPDSFIQGGLVSDFEGQVVEARFCPWDYLGTVDPPALGVRLTIRRDDGEDDVVQYYSAGDMSKFVPSMDGESPSVDADSYHTADEEGNTILNPEADGIYAFKVGSAVGLSSSSNWAQFIGALLDAEFDRSKLSGDIRFIEGVHGHFDRVPQIKRSGQIGQIGGDPGAKKSNDILVITKLTDAPGGAAGKAKPKSGAPTPKAASGAGSKPTPAPAAKPSASSAPPASSSGSLDDDLSALIFDYLRANDGNAKKSGVAGFIVKNATGVTKTKGVKRCTEAEFLERFNESEETPRWYYDADEGTLTLIEE